MPDLNSAIRWVRYEPDLGENRKQKSPFFLEVASGLTKRELENLATRVKDATAVKGPPPAEGEDAEAWLDAARDAQAERLAASYEGVVKVGSEPLSLKGKPVTGLVGYLRLIITQQGFFLLRELAAAVRNANSLEGVEALFSERHSGGFSFTGDPSAVKEESPTAAR